ncbi:hypothetical protein WI26_27195 [Burkholderia diffusa]|nr:hypothetical protein WI26_27195 [Burkholderia diffusa]
MIRDRTPSRRAIAPIYVRRVSPRARLPVRHLPAPCAPMSHRAARAATFPFPEHRARMRARLYSLHLPNARM